MTDTAHTPGPWDEGNPHEVTDGMIRVYGPSDEGPALVAEVYIQPGFDAQAEANATLIAAAPDLLEAIRGLLALQPVPFDGDRSPGAEAFRAGRNAVHKAEGR